MYLITFTYEVPEADQSEFIESIKALKSFWKSHGLSLSLYREVNRKDRIQQTFLTERTVEEITQLIREDPKARAFFEMMKTGAGHVIVSVYDKVL
jgi:hypothetical protein